MRVPWLCRDVHLRSPLAPETVEGLLRARILPYVQPPPARSELPYMGSVSPARFLLYPLGSPLQQWRAQARGRVRPDGDGTQMDVEVTLRPAAGAALHLAFATLVVVTLVTGGAMLARGELHVSGLVPLFASGLLFGVARWRFLRDADGLERFLEDVIAGDPASPPSGR